MPGVSLDDVKLHKGDIVCTRSEDMFGGVIRAVQKLWSKDNDARYNHCVIITGENGDSFEALETIRKTNLFIYHYGEECVIFRHALMTDEIFANGFETIKKYENNTYPIWRLIFGIIPPFMKNIGSGNFIVCSELASKFLIGCGFVEFIPYLGKTPDDITDMCRNYKYWGTVFEGVIKI